METTEKFENGTMSQMSIEPTYGGELMPVNNQADNDEQPSALEMAATIGLVMAVGYGVGKLGEFVFDKFIGPAAKKVGEKFDKKMAKKKNKPSKNENEDVLEGEFKDISEETETDESQEEQSLPKKGMNSINGVRKEKRKH